MWWNPSQKENRRTSRWEVLKWFKKELFYASTAAFLALLVAAFLAGSWHGSHKAAPAGAAGERKILYYVDPMNPAHTSPEPGLAPCGMKLEPVYAEGDAPDPTLPPGAVKITSQRQQLLGVRLAAAEKAPCTHLLRALGRVAIDETRIYRLNAVLDGWIKETHNNSTGSVVKKDETLATFYSPEFLGAQQAYMYALAALDRFQATGKETPEQIELTRKNIQQYVDSLRNLGMGELQIKEMERTRQFNENILISAPATSFVLARNVSPGQRFTAGTEWYRLADLSRVWILVDLYENEAQYVNPGGKVRVTYPYQKKTFQATVSQVLPQFDPATRTLKVRLEVDNPDFALRPDMFVDVNLPVNLPPTLNVPVDAVLDSGLKKTVFVDRGGGFFEPRKVETGWRLGDRVEITKGLKPGEKIVVSGNFLLDSESRMKLAARGMLGEVSQDPICGMFVEESKSVAASHKSEFHGQAYYFCSDQCQRQFEADPARYALQTAQDQAPPGDTAKEESAKVGDPFCGIEVDEAQARKSGWISEFQGKTYYFCRDYCKQQFEKDPARCLARAIGKGEEAVTSALEKAPELPATAREAACCPETKPGAAAPAGPNPAGLVRHPEMTPGAGNAPFQAGHTGQASPGIGQTHAMPMSAGNAQAMPTGHGQAEAGPMTSVAQPMPGTINDPVCGMDLGGAQALSAPWKSDYQGQTYYFCSEQCKQQFDGNPAQFQGGAVGAPAGAPSMAQQAAQPGAPHRGGPH
jgi:RND family efflux transporter MFP subunit